MKERLAYFDQMKAVAIIFVVIGHVFLFSFRSTHNSVDTLLCIFHMPIFFYISGYLAYKVLPDMKDVLKRLWKKTHALIFPYITFAGLYCLFASKDFGRLLLVGGAEYWFMYVLFILSIFFILFEQLVGRIKNDYLYVAVWVMPYVGLLFIQHRYGEIGGGIFAINQLVTYYRYYLIGYLCRKYVRLNSLLFQNQYVYALCLIAFFAKWFWYGQINIFVSMLGTMGAIITLQYFFTIVKKQDMRIMKMLSYIGQNSLEIYLLQYFFLPDLSSYIQPYIDVPNGFIWQLMMALTVTIPIIAACCFVGEIIKRNKILSWIMLGK